MVNRNKGKTILVIEDEPELRHFTSRVLELVGYHVLQAVNSAEGTTLVREGQVSLVLLDLKLPDRDGSVVLRQMKSEPGLSAIPVIVFTASAGVARRKRALSMGASDYLVKPVSAAELRKTVAHVLQQER